MQRLVAGTPGTLRHRFAVAPSGAVTVTAALHDGTPILTDAAAIDADADGIYEAAVDPADLAGTDLLTVDWDAGDGHVETEWVPVDVAPLVDRGALAAAMSGVSVSVYTQEEVAARVQSAVETYCGVAWGPRFHVQTLRADGVRELRLEKTRVRSIRSATLDGATVDTSGWDLWGDVGMVWPRSSLTAGGALVVAYEHGHDRPPFDVAQAALEVTKQLCRESVNRHTANRTEYAEGASWLIATASPQHGRLFGIPTQDAVFHEHREHALVAR